MSKVTSKLQVTIPKALADQYGVRPGDEIDFQPAGDMIRLVPPARRRPVLDKARRLRLFDAATERLKLQVVAVEAKAPPFERGWTREELYPRGRAR